MLLSNSYTIQSHKTRAKYVYNYFSVVFYTTLQAVVYPVIHKWRIHTVNFKSFRKKHCLTHFTYESNEIKYL